MISSLFPNWTKKAAGIEIQLISESEYLCQGIILTQKKGQIAIDRIIPQIQDLSLLLTSFEKTQPVWFIISGKTILTRKRDSKPLGPSSQAELFYQQEYPVDQQRSHAYTSLIRKDKLDPILQCIKEYAGNVKGISLGGVSLSTLGPLLVENKLEVGDSKWEFSQGILTDYQQIRTEIGEDNLRKEIDLGGDLLPAASLLAYAAAWAALMESGQFMQWDWLSQHKKQYQYEHLFPLLVKAGLAVFFVLLLGNFLLFNHYFSKKNQLEQQTLHLSSHLTRLDSLQQLMAARESWLEKTGWNTPSVSSFYTDQIAASLPTLILLKELTLYPQQQLSVTAIAKTPSFQANQILMKGLCNHPSEMTPVTEKLRAFHWIKQVTVVDYHFDTKEKKGSFIIQILLK
ncbi:hypothetical protein QNI16_36795 [Cytophagaceae bacterium YF14B1]|uniref:Uncharacterized protein n=1 Tax=Xanthocytophaga flava TaxID=3048013 RepID=A0AAE3R0J1_9BACT|nr:hypothetical protein [Xanthocytophaga flavus]MDJ1486099.1 hypothetical protein [Xanthocytophaga flavus]